MFPSTVNVWTGILPGGKSVIGDARQEESIFKRKWFYTLNCENGKNKPKWNNQQKESFTNFVKALLFIIFSFENRITKETSEKTEKQARQSNIITQESMIEFMSLSA